MAVQREDPPDEPTRVGAYRIDARMAAGGFGVVYRATHVERGTPAAVKIVHADLASNAAVVARFEREIDAIRRVDHPNVIAVLDHGLLADGRPYFVMDLLAGIDLDDHQKARGRLSADETLAIFEPLCAAVAAAHARSIVHRDIKASNVFLADEGGARRVVLLDFGVAKLLDAEGPGLTASRQVVGSFSCMAPEQIFEGPVDARTDVYALGALAYRLLTGEVPFAATSLATMQQMHLHAVPRLPSTRAPVSPAFDRVLLRALAKDRAARQPGAAAFLDELRAAALTVTARPRRSVVVFLELQIDPDALDAPGEALLDDLERVLPAAAADLAPLGLEIASSTGTSLLLARVLPDEAADDAQLRREVTRAVAALSERLSRRPGRDPAVEVRLYVHAGTLAVDGGGQAVGGALLQMEAWLPEASTVGALASREALAGLDAPGGEAWTTLRAGSG
jgi:serine/threonine-protein kinase